MVSLQIEHKTLFRWKITGLFICWGVFLVFYSLAGSYAASLEHVPSLYFAFEKHIPFISYMIYPYISSGPFFIYVFFLCRTPKELSILIKRIIFITLVSGICFFLFPLKQHFIRPDTGNILLAFLDKYDTPFNQAPSLHIGYIFIFWSAMRNCKFKLLLRSWLCLMAISTLTLYQHHLIDVISASALGWATLFFFPYRRERNKQIAKVYLVATTLLLIAALFMPDYSIGCSIGLSWCGVTLALIARAYYKSNAGFLKNERGDINICHYIAYLPYILTYWALWLFSRKTIRKIAPGIYIGGRISQWRAKSFSQNSHIAVFDLSAELPENPYFRRTATYHCMPMLDIGSTPEAYATQIINAILAELAKSSATEKIYIHCTMGRFRSRRIAELLLHKLSKMQDKN